MKNILVIGGAGYIGSACTKLLYDAGYNIYVIDNLSTGYKKAVDKRAHFEKIDILKRRSLFNFLKNKKFDAIIHLAAHKSAEESMKNPSLYLENMDGMVNVLDGMVKYKIPKIIFSSSAAVYGNPIKLPIEESHPLHPINFYGETKLICERLIERYAETYKLNYIILRYFNVVGDIGLKFKEKNARNLFPAIKEVISGKLKHLEIFGKNYKTKDGTCIRDYIHLKDIANAHLLALKYKKSDIFNLGINKGHSVLKIVKAFEKALGKNIPKKYVKPRLGDPPKLIANAKKANKYLKWNVRNDLKKMVESSLY